MKPDTCSSTLSFDADPGARSACRSGRSRSSRSPTTRWTRGRSSRSRLRDSGCSTAPASCCSRAGRTCAAERAPFAKGLLAWNVLASAAYSGAAFAHAGPPERDTRGMAAALGVNEAWVGATDPRARGARHRALRSAEGGMGAVDVARGEDGARASGDRGPPLSSPRIRRAFAPGATAPGDPAAARLAARARTS